MFGRKLASSTVAVAREDDATTIAKPAVTPRSKQGSAVTPSSSPSGRSAFSRRSRIDSRIRSASTAPPPLQRSNTWAQSSNALLKMATEGSSINVLRMSLFEMHDRRRYRWVLHPQSPFKAFWDLLSAIVVIYYSWIIPFMLCFDWYEPSGTTKKFMKALDAWGALDILLRFRTGIIEYGNVVMKPHVIRRTYLRSVWFPIDIASTFPFEYFIKDDMSSISTRKTIKMIKYIKLPRLLRLGRFFKYLQRYKRYSSLSIAINMVVFTAHVSGCMWVAILKPCASAAEAERPHCADGNELEVYWIAFHHGMMSLLGVSADHVENSSRFLSGAYGYSSTDDLNSKVYIWASAVSLAGTVLTAILFGTVFSLVQSWNRAENAFRKKMDHVTHEMDALSLPKPLRARITAYYDYLWLNNRALSEQLSLLHDPGMSLALRRQIAIYLFKDNLQKIPFFQLATDAVLGMICMQLHQVIYMPEDFIIREGEIGKELFMIVKGIVRVLPPNGCKKPESESIILLGEGDFFGEIGVVMEVERTRSVKAECMAELCVLSREGFDKILVEFPEFATAMKKLIVKRVGEMWKGDGPERMEKMTALADAKMKKSVQAYKNLEKLRNKTRALQTFHPRLSNLLKSTEVLSPAEIKALPGAKNTLAAAVAAAAAAVVSDTDTNAPNHQCSTPSLGSLVPITEDNPGDEAKAESEFDPVPTEIRTLSDHEPDARPEQHGTPLRSITGRRTSPISGRSSSPLHLQQLESQLRQVEQKVEDRMANLDDKLEQILHHLAAARTSSHLPPL